MASFIHGPKQAPAIPGIPAEPESVLFGRSAVPEVHEGSKKTPTPESSPGHYLPCLNPSCKSHGRPHPNCRCYSGGESYERFADGGEVGFCSSDRAHKSDCEYFSDGGQALPSYDEVMGSQQQAMPSYDEVMGGSKAQEGLPSYDEVMGSNNGGGLEQLKAVAEGAAKGLLGPLAPMLETGLGISTKEAINKREQDFPLTHGAAEATTFAGSMLLGTGEAGLIAKGAEAVSKAAEMGTVGSAILKGAIGASSVAASDEMTKAFLGQQGSDPEHPVSAALLNVGAAGLMGSLTGGVFGLGEGIIGKGINSELGAKAASEAQKYLFELGQSDSPLTKLGVAATVSVPAYETSKSIEQKTGIPSWVSFMPVEALYTLVGKKALDKINPVIIAAAVKALAENSPDGVPNAVHIATKALKGAKSVADAMNQISSAGAAKIAPDITDFSRKHLKEFIEGGQINTQMQNTMHDQDQQQGFAHGGEVKSEPNMAFAKAFPTQNTILNTAKGRIANYLNTVRPSSMQQKKVFDDAHQNKEQERQYNKAIDFAVSPMSILDHVNSGDLTPEHMKHFVSLYPEVHGYLSKEMTKKIVELQMKGEKPPYHKRQAMSLFLGADLDSSFSPLAVQTIQGLYAGKQQAQQQQVSMKNKKGASNLSKGPSSQMTDDQARERRLQSQK